MSFWFLLFTEYFKTGLFAVGGGLATIPFLYDIAERYPWFSVSSIPDIIAVAQSLPGPVGVNMSAFSGYLAGGVPGALTAGVSLVIPSVIIIVIIARFLNKFRETHIVEHVFYGLRPTACALIVAAALEVFRVTLVNLPLFEQTGRILSLLEWKSVLLLCILLFLINRYKKNPAFYILGAALVGIIFQF